MGEKRHLVVLMLIVMGCLLIQGCSVGMALRECPAYILLYQFSPKDTGQSKVK